MWIEKMKKLAEKFNVNMSKTAPKIAKIKERHGDENLCPCAVDDEERGCISDKCYKEIQEQGHCHCRAFTKKEEE